MSGEIVLSEAPDERDYAALTKFADYCNEQSRARGFHETPDKLKDLAESLRESDPVLSEYLLAVYYGNRLMLLSGEITEAHEELRSGHTMDESYEVNGKPEGVPSEAADIFIRLMDLVKEAKIDLAGGVQGKLAYNATRIAMHGRKF